MNAVIRTALAVAAATALLTGAAAAVAAPASASQLMSAVSAASQVVEFSSDGIHWSDSYTGALFGGILLIPGGSAERPLYVRNGADEAGVLRVTLFDVTTTDVDLAAVLSLTTSTPGVAGTAVPVSAARPCATLASGQILASGDSIRFDNLVTLGALTGTAGQGKTVGFKIAVTLSSTDATAPAPNTCPTDGTDGGTVVGIPDQGTSAVSSSAPTVYHLAGTGWTTTTGSGSTAPAVGGDPVVPPPIERTLVANTERLYQENYVAFWLAMAVLGALIFLIMRRRRPDEDAPYHPSTQTAHQPTQQNGTGR